MNLAQQVLAEISRPMASVEEKLRAVLSEAEGLAATMSLHLLEGGGKRVRPMMTLLSAQAFGGDLERVVPIAAAAEMIHMATLVHDDVIDRAETRRGHPTVSAVWGNHRAVLTGDFLLARAMTLIVDHGAPGVLKVMSDMIYQMCEGEIAQLSAQGRLDAGPEEYFQRIRKKTALFFEACCQSGALMAGAHPRHVEAIGRFGLNIGMAFQVVDDLLDVVGDERTLGKPAGSDLASGVVTLPVIYLLQSDKHRDQVVRRLSKPQLSPEDVQDVLRLVRENGAVSYTRDVASRYAEEALKHLRSLPPNHTVDLMERMAAYIVERQL